jgi:hypothetical protein
MEQAGFEAAGSFFISFMLSPTISILRELIKI